MLTPQSCQEHQKQSPSTCHSQEELRETCMLTVITATLGIEIRHWEVKTKETRIQCTLLLIIMYQYWSINGDKCTILMQDVTNRKKGV